MQKNTNCVIYEIEYFKHFDSKNSFYLIFNNIDAYIEYNPTENYSETKHLVFPFTDKNREALENYENFEMKLKIKLKQQIVIIQLNMGKIL